MSLALSPIFSLSCGFVLIISIIFILYSFGFYSDSTYFQWGCPFVFLTYEVTSNTFFYVLLALMFAQQIVTSWIYDVVYPWIIGTIQNPRETEIPYSRFTCVMIVNMNSLYSQIHLAFIISGITSQISFLVVLIIADLITLSYINWQYVKTKNFVKNIKNEANEENREADNEVELPSIETIDAMV